MNTLTGAPAVFLSYTASDANIADVVEAKLVDAGIKVFDHRDIAKGANIDETLRQALVESSALVMIASPASMKSSWLPLEVGAAMVWNKPVHVLRSGVSAKQLPTFLRPFKSYPLSKLSQVVKALSTEVESNGFDDDQIAVLKDLYVKLDTPIDQLARQPASLGKIARAFNSTCGVDYTPERILQKLLALRKKRRLSRLQKCKSG